MMKMMNRNEMPILSIITVSYNAVDTIERTILSVLAQRVESLEYIIIDGGSKDGTVDIIKKYEHDVDYWCSEPDNGIYNAMNKGIKKATGEYIGIINADDYYFQDVLTCIVNAIKTSNADIIYGDLIKAYLSGEYRQIPFYSLNEMDTKMAVPHPSSFIKRDIYNKFGGYDEKYKIAADYALLSKLYYEKCTFYYVPTIVTVFSEGGISTEDNKLCAEETCIIIARNMMKYLEINTFEQKWKVYASLYGIINYHFPSIVYEYLEGIFGHLEDGVIIYGSGRLGTGLKKLLDKLNIVTLFFVDNDVEKQNKNHLGVKVVGAKCIASLNANIIIAIKGGTIEMCSGMGERANIILIEDLREGVVNKFMKEYEVDNINE